MKKSKKMFLAVLSVFLLSGTFGINASALDVSTDPHNRSALARGPVDDGGAPASQNAGRGHTRGTNAQGRPFGSASITVTRASAVGGLDVSASINAAAGGAVSHPAARVASTTNMNTALANGTRHTTGTVTANRNIGVTSTFRYNYRPTGRTTWTALPNISHTW